MVNNDENVKEKTLSEISNEFMEKVSKEIQKYDTHKKHLWKYEIRSHPNYLLTNFQDFVLDKGNERRGGTMLFTCESIALPEINGDVYVYDTYQGEPFVYKAEKRVDDSIKFGVELSPRFVFKDLQGKQTVNPDLSNPYDVTGVITYNSRQGTKYAYKDSHDSIMAFITCDLITGKVLSAQKYPFVKQSGLDSRYFAAEPALMSIQDLKDKDNFCGVHKFVEQVYRSREIFSPSDEKATPQILKKSLISRILGQ